MTRIKWLLFALALLGAGPALADTYVYAGSEVSVIYDTHGYVSHAPRHRYQHDEGQRHHRHHHHHRHHRHHYHGHSYRYHSCDRPHHGHWQAYVHEVD